MSELYTDTTLAAVNNNSEVQSLYEQYTTLTLAKNESPQPLEDLIFNVGNGELGGFSLLSCVKGVLDAYIWQLVTTDEEKIRLANLPPKGLTKNKEFPKEEMSLRSDLLYWNPDK